MIVSPRKNLNEVHPASVFLDLCNKLDKNRRWERLIGILPEFYTINDREQNRIESEEYRKNGSPSKVLLQELGNMGFTVGQLSRCLERLEMEDVLIHIKKFEPVKISGDLPNESRVEEGLYNCFKIEIRATGFPSPQYQWQIYNETNENWKDLENQKSSIFILKPVRLMDAEKYRCKVFNTHSVNPNEFSSCFSNVMKLNVTKSSNTNTTEHDNSAPEIILQPSGPSPGKLAVGSALALMCVAQSATPMTYEWYQNGKLFSVNDNGKLFIEQLRSVDDETKFTFHCLVKNSHGKVISNPVRVALLPLRAASQDASPQYIAEDKVALLFGNQHYDKASNMKLPSATFDAIFLARLLRELDFKVITLVDLTKTEMEQAVKEFCKLLVTNAYVVFYYAGHGYQSHGQCYMMPVDASINSGPSECLCLDYILQLFQQYNPALCCMIIDMCRKDLVKDDGISEVMYEPKVNRNTIFAYATTQSCTALDGEKGKNGVYMGHLINYIKEDKPIVDVLQKVVYDVSGDSRASKLQYPQNVSNIGWPLKLTDKVIPADTDRAQLRRQHYEYLIDHIPDFSCQGGFPGTTLHFHLEAFDQVVHNMLRVNISVTSNAPNQLYFASIEEIVTSDSIVKAIYSQERVGRYESIEVFIQDIQKITEPLVLKVTTNSHCQKSKPQLIDLGLPMIAKVKLYLTSDESVARIN